MALADMVVVGDVCLDIVQRPPIAFAGLTSDVRVSTPIHQVPGGAGLNFASVAQDAGFRPLLLAAVGNDAAGEILAGHLDARGLDAGVERITGRPTGVALLTYDQSGIRLMVDNAPSANDYLSAAMVRRHAEAIARAGILYISGYAVVNGQAPRAAAVREALTLVSPAATVVFDAVPHRLHEYLGDIHGLRKAVSRIDVFLSEVATARRLLGVGSPDEEVTAEIARETAVLFSTHCRRLVLRFGKNGSDNQLVWDNGTITCEPTGYVEAGRPAGFGDTLAVATIRDVFNLAPVA